MSRLKNSMLYIYLTHIWEEPFFVMACKVERFQSIGKGRGLRATSPASPGEVLYVAEPFAYTVLNAGRGKLCEFCLTITDHLLQCSLCKFAKYCGKQCQAEAWLDHKRECKCLKSAKSNFDTDSFRFVEGLKFYLNEEILADINLVELYAKEMTNGFVIANITTRTQSAAVGLYPSMSLLNHSCEPNCIAGFKGQHLHLRAIRKIQAGEELTIAYVRGLKTTEQRQSELKFKYCFECDCRRCLTCDKDEEMLAGDKQLSEQTKQLEKKVLELQSKHQWKESLDLCRAQLQRNTGRVPDQNIYQLSILMHAMIACTHLALPEEGLHYVNRALEPYKMYTTGISAIWAEHMFNLGDILTFQGKADEAANTLQEAYEVLKVFKGTDDPMTQTVTFFLQQFHT